MLNAEEEGVKQEGEAENIQTTTPVVEQEATEEVSQIEAEPTGEAEAETTETVEGPKKGENQRIRELVKERNEAKAEAKSLAQKMAELTGSVQPSGDGQPYVPQVEPGVEITPEQYQQDVMRRADSLVDIRIKQSNAINRINSESQETMRTFPQLDPDSDSFDQELSDTVTEATEAYVKANPYDASVKGFVAKLMKPYQRAVTKEAGKVAETIAKQTSETALRPNSIRKEEKKTEEKSIEELEKELGVVNA